MNARTSRAAGATAAILAAGAVAVAGNAGAEPQTRQTTTTPERISTEQQLRESIQQAATIERRLGAPSLNPPPTGRVDATGPTHVC